MTDDAREFHPDRSGSPRPVRWEVRSAAILVVILMVVALDWVAGFMTYQFGGYRQEKTWDFRTNVGKGGLRRQDANAHHGLTARHTGQDSWGKRQYPVATNSLGFKDATPRDVPLQSDEPRLLFIGDSFTEGIGYPYEQTWVGLVDKELAAQGVTVLNGGVASYCPKTVYYKVKALLESDLQVSRIVFFIDVSDMADELLFNDFVPANRDADDAWIGRYVRTPKQPTLAQYSLAYHALLKRRKQDPWKKTLFTDSRTGASFTFDSKERESWTRDPQPEWIAAAEASAAYYVRRLAALCASRGIEFEIAIYPWPEEIDAGDAHSHHRTFWRDFCADENLTCYDLHDPFIPADPVLRRQIRTRDFIPGDVHWNEAGHRLVATEWLRQYRQRHPD